MSTGDASRAIHLLVADALEALIPLVDVWARDAERHLTGAQSTAYAEGYRAGTRAMSREVKDQLVERVLRLRE